MIYVKPLTIRQIVPKIVLHGHKKANRKKSLNYYIIPVDSIYVQVHLRKIYEPLMQQLIQVFVAFLLFQFSPKKLFYFFFIIVHSV